MPDIEAMKFAIGKLQEVNRNLLKQHSDMLAKHLMFAETQKALEDLRTLLDNKRKINKVILEKDDGAEIVLRINYTLHSNEGITIWCSE